MSTFESKDAESKCVEVAEAAIERFSRPCKASSTAAQQDALRRRQAAAGTAGERGSSGLENEAGALVEWEEHFDGGDGGHSCYDDEDGGLESSLRTNKATAGTLSTRTFDGFDGDDDQQDEHHWQEEDEALPPMSVEEAYDTVKRYTRTPEFLSPFVEHIRTYISSFADYLKQASLQDATVEEATHSEKPHEWYASFQEYNALFEEQIRQILFVCGTSNEEFYELVESKADGKLPQAPDDAAFIATVKATLDFDDYVKVMIDEAKNRRFTVDANAAFASGATVAVSDDNQEKKSSDELAEARFGQEEGEVLSSSSNEVRIEHSHK